jgi:hypothetical protein
VIFAQEVEDLFRFSGLGEGGVAAQVAEDHDDLAAMAFEDFLVALRDDQLGQLWREKPQLAHHAEPRAVLVEEPQVAVGPLALARRGDRIVSNTVRRGLAVPISALRVPKNQGRMRAPTANEAHETRALTPGHRYSSLLTPRWRERDSNHRFRCVRRS